MPKTLWMNKIKIIRMLSNHSKAGRRKQEKKKNNPYNVNFKPQYIDDYIKYKWSKHNN